MIIINHPRVSIIILNWNGWRDTIECLQSLYAIKYSNYQVVVIDNGSTDNSNHEIERYLLNKESLDICFINYKKNNIILKETQKVYPVKKDDKFIKTIFIKNEMNYGFAEGNNIGIKYILGLNDSDYILLLNNDTIVHEDFLDELVSIAVETKEIAFVGPKVYYYNYKGRKDILSFAGGCLNFYTATPTHIGDREIDNEKYDYIRDVDYLEGSCLLANIEAIKKIGLLDASFFSYWEDTDWCIRARKKGFRAVYSPSSKIWHKVSTSSNKISGLNQYYMVRNSILFTRKNASKGQLIVFLIFFLLIKFWILNIKYILIYHNLNINISIAKGAIDGFITN